MVSNVSAQLLPRNTLSSFAGFSAQQLSIERQWEVAVSGMSYLSMNQTVTQEKFMFFDKNLSTSSEIYYLKPCLYLSIRNIVEAMNTLINERHDHSESCIPVKVSRRMQKVEICLANERSGLAILGTDLEQIFGGNVGNELEVMLKQKTLKT